jgi:hypothetical protein
MHVGVHHTMGILHRSVLRIRKELRNKSQCTPIPKRKMDQAKKTLNKGRISPCRRKKEGW